MCACLDDHSSAIVSMWRPEDTFLGASFSSSIMWVPRSKLSFSVPRGGLACRNSGNYRSGGSHPVEEPLHGEEGKV